MAQFTQAAQGRHRSLLIELNVALIVLPVIRATGSLRFLALITLAHQTALPTGHQVLRIAPGSLTGGTESLASSGTGIPILLFQIIIAITDQGIAGIFSFVEEG